MSAAIAVPTIWQVAKLSVPAVANEVPEIVTLAKALLRMKRAGLIAELWIDNERIRFSHLNTPTILRTLSRETARVLMHEFERREELNAFGANISTR